MVSLLEALFVIAGTIVGLGVVRSIGDAARSPARTPFAEPMIQARHRSRPWRWLALDLGMATLTIPVVVTAAVLVVDALGQLAAPTPSRAVALFGVSVATALLVRTTLRLLQVTSRLAELEEWLESSGIQQGRAKLTEAEYQRVVREAVSAWTDIDLVCVTGYATLGKEQATLGSLVNKPPGRVRVLLLDPFSEAFAKRAERLGRPADEYRLATQATVTVLERLSRKGYDVSYKFFRTTPVWRMYVGPTAALFQTDTGAISRFEAPLYGVRRTDHTVALYDALRVYFDDRWRGLPDPSVGARRMVEKIRTELAEQSGLFTLKMLEAARERGLDEPLRLPARPRRKSAAPHPS